MIQQPVAAAGVSQGSMAGQQQATPWGTKAWFKRNIREPGMAVLRRDKPAQTKLYMVYQIRARMDKENVTAFEDLAPATRQHFRVQFGEQNRFINQCLANASLPSSSSR